MAKFKVVLKNWAAGRKREQVALEGKGTARRAPTGLYRTVTPNLVGLSDRGPWVVTPSWLGRTDPEAEIRKHLVGQVWRGFLQSAGWFPEDRAVLRSADRLPRGLPPRRCGFPRARAFQLACGRVLPHKAGTFPIPSFHRSPLPPVDPSLRVGPINCNQHGPAALNVIRPNAVHNKPVRALAQN